MALETVSARYQIKDEAGNVQLDEEGKPLWSQITADYDFGDSLDHAVEAVGEDVAFSLYKAQGRIALQAIVRAKKKAGMVEEQIQDFVTSWKPGMIMERSSVSHEDAIKAAFSTWSPEKQAEFLSKLGVAA